MKSNIKMIFKVKLANGKSLRIVRFKPIQKGAKVSIVLKVIKTMNLFLLETPAINASVEIHVNINFHNKREAIGIENNILFRKNIN
jgi:hypothetical protein